MNRQSANVIKRRAVGKGMLTLRMDGWRKIGQGVTTLEEVLRVTQEDELEVRRDGD